MRKDALHPKRRFGRYDFQVLKGKPSIWAVVIRVADLPWTQSKKTANLEDVERIEIIRGPGATVWGANAVNGVINVITKHAGNYSAKRLNKGRCSLSYSSITGVGA